MSMNPDRDNTTPEQTCEETWARPSSQPRVGTQTETQAEMLNIQHYRSSLDISAKSWDSSLLWGSHYFIANHKLILPGRSEQRRDNRGISYTE